MDTDVNIGLSHTLCVNISQRVGSRKKGHDDEEGLSTDPQQSFMNYLSLHHTDCSLFNS